MKTKTIVMYNGLPIKLTRSYAQSELKNSELFVSRLKANIESGRITEDRKQSAFEVLKRRTAWIEALKQYLNSGDLSRFER